MPGLPNPWIILAVVLAFVGSNVFTAYKTNQITAENVDAKWIGKYAELEAQKNIIADAAQAYYVETEAKNLEQTQAWEAKSNAQDTYIRGLQLANGRLVDANCGMFDRNGRPTGSGGADGAPLASDPALSAQGYPAICKLPGAVRAAVQRFGRGVGQLLLEADVAAGDAILGHDLAVAVDDFRATVMELNREAVPR